MPSHTMHQLIAVLRGCIQGGNHARALRLLVTNLPRTDGHYLLRRSVADILADMGRTKEAVEIYEILVRHLTNSGHPFLALSVAHKLSQYEDNVGSHYDHLARTYCQESPHIETSRALEGLASTQPNGPLDLSGTVPDLSLEALVETAHGFAILKDNFISTPLPVPPIPLLSRLDQRTLRTLVELLRPVTFEDEEVVCSDAHPLDTPLFIADGSLKVTRASESALVGPGAVLGHRTLLGERAADFQMSSEAVGFVEALALDAQTMPMVQGDAAILAVSRRFDIACLVERAIERSNVFSKVAHEDRWELLEVMKPLHLVDNTTLIHQGQVGDGLYLIVDGRTDINKRDGEWDVTFKSLEIGEVVGEISLVTEGPAIASVVTDGDTRVLFISPDAVHRLCGRFPSVMAELRESAAKRLLSHAP